MATKSFPVTYFQILESVFGPLKPKNLNTDNKRQKNFETFCHKNAEIRDVIKTLENIPLYLQSMQ